MWADAVEAVYSTASKGDCEVFRSGLQNMKSPCDENIWSSCVERVGKCRSVPGAFRSHTSYDPISSLGPPAKSVLSGDTRRKRLPHSPQCDPFVDSKLLRVVCCGIQGQSLLCREVIVMNHCWKSCRAICSFQAQSCSVSIVSVKWSFH